jgi:hypothetical protein
MERARDHDCSATSPNSVEGCGLGGSFRQEAFPDYSYQYLNKDLGNVIAHSNVKEAYPSREVFARFRIEEQDVVASPTVNQRDRVGKTEHIGSLLVLRDFGVILLVTSTT